MVSIIEKLQRDAEDPNVEVSTLLRQVKIAAVKLGVGSVEDWVEHELNGYSTGASIPEYRRMTGRPMVQNPYRGWMPIGGEIADISRRPNGQSVAVLESLIKRHQKGSRLHWPYPDEISSAINKMNGTTGWNCGLEIDQSQVIGILDRVRNLVLDWALNLEKAGILGTDVGFDEEEKRKARSSITTITIGSIGSLVGNLGGGTVTGGIVASFDGQAAKALIDQIKPRIDEISAAGADRSRLEDRITAVERELENSSPDQGVLRGLMTDLRNVLVGAAGNLAAMGAIAAINQILGTGVPM